MKSRLTWMMIVALALLASLRFVSSASAGNTFIYDFFSPYLQRIDGITPGAGDAKEVNSVTHTIDPWPPYVTNRHIPGDGQRMTGAIERYRDVSKLPLAPQPIAPLIDAKSFSGGAGGGTSGGGSSAH